MHPDPKNQYLFAAARLIRLFIATVLIAGLAAAGPVHASTNMVPIAATGYNWDVVIESTASGPPFSTYASEMNAGEGTAFYQAGLPGYSFGLPASDSFTSAADNSTVFQFQPYTSNNALILSADTGITDGTLTLAAPATYISIAVLAHSGSGENTGTASLTVNFTDGTSFATNYFAPDWFFNNGNANYGVALQGPERININGGGTDGSPGNPRFYQTTIYLAQVLGANNKPVASLTFGKAAANSTAVYAVSGWDAVVTAPVVTNAPATAIESSSAVLNGGVASAGGVAPTVTVYYGTADGGTTAANWQHSLTLSGVQSGAFSQAVTGLSPNSTYYFTANGVNSAGPGWASPSLSFTTLTPALAVVTNLPATNLLVNAAQLSGQILATGNSTPYVTIYFGTNNGGTAAVAWSNSIPVGFQTDVYSATVTGLSSNTTYFYTSAASNAAGTTWAAPVFQFATPATNPLSASVAMLTFHNDNTRQGVNTNETKLTLANVNASSFGRLFSYPVDGFVYAQPLIMTNVTIPGQAVHNVLYVATENDSVYAFDADNTSGTATAPFWHTSFINPAAGVTVVPGGDTGTDDILPQVGITATPVIDPGTGTIYVEVKTKEVKGGNTSYVHRLHALDITTGLERTTFNSPALIAATNYPGVGRGDNDGHGHVLWNGQKQHSRPGLTLLNGVILVCYASHGDNDPYHGWLFAYDARTLAQLSVYNSTPNGGRGGFWQGGGGPTVDANGNFYLQTGNGDSSTDFNATGSTFDQAVNNFAMSALKFTVTNGAIKLLDFFTPSDQANQTAADNDLSSGAALVLPDSAGSAAHPHLLAVAGKNGSIYLVDRDNMGHFNSAGNSQIVQEIDGALAAGSYMTPVYFNNWIYYVGMDDTVKAYRMSGGLIRTPPIQGRDTFGYKASTSPSLSAHGTTNAILWMIDSEGQEPSGQAILRAYNATNVASEIYNSSQAAGRDNPGASIKFTVPTVVNGKVYVGAQYAVSVFGLGTFLPAPAIAPNGGIFTNSVTVTLSDTSPNAKIYYTLDGTTPTTNSPLYTSPLVITNSTGLSAIAAAPGTVNSAVTTASFINSSSIGTGTGLLGQYYANASPNTPFTGTPALTRTDPFINFNWDATTPAPNVGPNNYTVRWTGMIQPQFSQTYTFSTTTDDGVRLWVNGRELVNEWMPQGPTTWSGAIQLLAQQYYNLEMDYYQAGGGAVAELQWSSSSTALQVIPETQLYPETNPPPLVAITSPANNATYTATASVTIIANAAAQYNALTGVTFYSNGRTLGTVASPPYAITATGLVAGNYAFTAVAADTTGLSRTSAPVAVSVKSGTGLAYGLNRLGTNPPFLNMPATINGALPAKLSLTGVFTNTANLGASASLVPYAPIVPLWSDGALKTRYVAVPNNGGPYTPNEQISFSPGGYWSFPAGTVFVKTFELLTNQSDPNSLRRLETRLLVRDNNGAVYGVTYKWRPDNSDADLLAGSSNENIAITTPGGVITQTWYYPSPADCLQCHTPAANYVLGLNTRQFNSSMPYPSGVTDNQLRTLNHLGLLYPAIDEAAIAGYEKLSALTNTSASLQERVKSYLDANCAQCHQPGATGPSFDARYETPLVNQNLILGVPVKGDLGYDHAAIVTPDDLLRSVLYDRMDSTNSTIKMPPLARNLIDTNAVTVLAAWINSLPGTPALEPPMITPDGGVFDGSVSVTLTPPDADATLYYTLDGSLPTTSSAAYTGPFTLLNTATVTANALESGYATSVAVSALFTVQPNLVFNGPAGFTNGVFQLQLQGAAGQSYVLQATTNFSNWISISTNTPAATPFYLIDPGASNYPYRFYRAMQTR